jgi:hypothetical protein
VSNLSMLFFCLAYIRGGAWQGLAPPVAGPASVFANY